MYIDGEIVTDEYEDTDTSAAGFRNALKSLGDVKSLYILILQEVLFLKELQYTTC